MTVTLRTAVDRIVNRAEAGADNPATSAEDLLMYAKTLTEIGPASAVNFISATTEAQYDRLMGTGGQQNARIVATGDSEVQRVKDTMGTAIGVLKSKGDLLVHDGDGVARVPVGTTGQILAAGAGGLPGWVRGARHINTVLWNFWDVSQVNWGGYGNIIPGSNFTYVPLKANSKLLVEATLCISSWGDHSGAWIMWLPNGVGHGWHYGPNAGMCERYNGATFNTATGGTNANVDLWNGERSQFGNVYNGDSHRLANFTSTPMMINLGTLGAWNHAQGVQFGITCHSRGSWVRINETGSQSGGYPQRYGISSITIHEFEPITNTSAL